MDEAVAHVAGRALAVLDERGWGQGEDVFQLHGPACLGIAIKVAVRGTRADVFRVRDDVFRAAEQAAYGGMGYESIIEWNDAPGRTEEDVVLVLKRMVAGDYPA